MINIDVILKEKRLSKTEVAKRMELSRESLYRILSGNPTLDNITKLASALEVSVCDLFEKPDEQAEQDVMTCPKCGQRFKMET